MTPPHHHGDMVTAQSPSAKMLPITFKHNSCHQNTICQRRCVPFKVLNDIQVRLCLLFSYELFTSGLGWACIQDVDLGLCSDAGHSHLFMYLFTRDCAH